MPLFWIVHYLHCYDLPDGTLLKNEGGGESVFKVVVSEMHKTTEYTENVPNAIKPMGK